MTGVVIDASVAIKWVIEEEGTTEALALLSDYRLEAPDLLIAECANILWKKVQRRELLPREAGAAARLLQAADIALYPTRRLLEATTELAISIEHPAYDCVYLALAMAHDRPFITSDRRLLHGLAFKGPSRLRELARPLVPKATP